MNNFATLNQTKNSPLLPTLNNLSQLKLNSSSPIHTRIENSPIRQRPMIMNLNVILHLGTCIHALLHAIK